MNSEILFINFILINDYSSTKHKNKLLHNFLEEKCRSLTDYFVCVQMIMHECITVVVYLLIQVLFFQHIYIYDLS